MKELYDNLFKSGDYTKSFEEFVNQFGDTEKSKVLYNALNEAGDYTKSFEEFVVQFGFGEKKKTDDTSSSTLETEDMVSTTEEDPTDGSLDSSEVTETSIPQVTTPEVEDDYEYLKDDLLKLEEIETASTQTYTPGASARARAMREKNREVDPILKSKLLSDHNISSALEFNVIDDRTLDAALKGNKNALKTIQSLSRKRKEEYLQEIQEKRLDKQNAYEDSSNLNAYEVTEDEKTKKDQAVKKVNDFNKETERLLSQIENPTEEQLAEIYQRDGAPTEEEYDLAEDFITPTGFEDSDIDDMYDSQRLKNIKGFNAKDFDGYLSEMGYKEKYKQLLDDEVVSENGRFYDISGNYNPTLASERLKFQYLSNYINDKVERNVESQILKYQAENDGRHPSFDGVKIDFSTGLDDKAISSYVEEQFPTLTSYLKDRDRENQKNYQEYLNGENPWVNQSVKQGWRSVEDRISSFSEGVYEFIGMSNTADEIRMSAAQTELERDDFMRYTYASGKKATIDGREYGIDERGQIYDLQIKKNVTQVLTEDQEKSIRKKVEGSDETFKSFSSAGAVIATSGIASDMVLQIALTRGVANLGAGGSAFLGAFDKGSKVLNVLSKIPMKANTASAMIAQGTLFATNMSSDAYKKAIENGVDQETAEEIRQLASGQGYALGALTAPISTQVTAMNKIFGEQGSKKISESVVRIYQESGKKGVNAYFQKVRQNIIQNYPVYFRESGKEMFQENVQQAGQAFIIADNVNELAGKEIMMNTITGAEYTNTTILAGMAGLLMPFGGDLTSATGSSLKASFRPGEAAIDRMEALHALSRNSKKTKELLDGMVKKGVYSQEQADNIISDVDVYSKNIGRVPPNLTPETSLKVMGSLEKINQLENQKKNLDQSFHADIDKKIQDIRTQVTKATEFDYVNIKGKTKLKEDAGKQLTKEAEERGEKDFTIEDSAITERAIDNFSKMTIEEKLSYTDIQDAIQEQETREVPDAKPAEGVQEVEEEVRITPEEEAEVETTPKVEPLKTTKPNKKLKDAFDDNTISEEDLEAMTLYALNKKQNGKRLTPFEKRLLEDTSVERTEQIADLQIKLEDNIKALREEELDLRTEAARKRKKAEEEVETKKFEDDDVVLKEETFTVTDEFGNKTVTTVKTNLDGSLRKAEVESFDKDGNSLGKITGAKLADNDIVVRDGLTAEQLLTQRLQEGEVIEKTSERSGNEINNPKKTAQLTTDQKQKLGIETETKKETKVSEIDEVKVTEEKVVPSGKRLFNDPNPETTEISKKYKKDRNIETPDGTPVTSIDKNKSKEIADVFESLEDSPNDPKVQEAYSAMADETAEQHKAIIEAGYEVEIWKGKGEPYANSQEMIEDVRENKHMYIYSTETGFGDAAITKKQRQQNKLLQDSGFKDKNGETLLYNDLFRFVHDFFGHTERGNGFGPVGEENAWDVHSRMYSPLARRAMTSETRGQNSWVNFGPKMRNKKGELIKKGEEGYLSPKDRPFAPQKMALMPEKYSELLPESKGPIDESEQTQTKKDPKKSLEKTKKDFEQSEQALKNRVKKPTFKQKLRLLREKIFDRQTRVKDLLKGVGNKEATKAKNLLVTKAGATGFANFRFKKADDKIYKGLKDQDLKTLDHIIYLRRLKAINENRKAQGKEPYVGINDTDYDTAVAALRGYEEELGDKKYKDFESRADKYFESMNESLTRMKDSGLISEEVFNQLKDIDYSPIKTLDYIIPDNADAAEIDRMAEISGMKADVIKTLSDKNLKDIIMDTRWLLSSNLGMIEAKVFENKMLNAFSEAVESAEGDVKTEIENYVLPNPVIGKTKEGKPKRKYDKKTPPGFTKVHFKKDGVDKYMVIDNAYANQLLDIKKSSDVNLGKVGDALINKPVQALRFFATSGNPLFIVGNTAVDFQNILFLSDVYSNNKFKGGAELAFDFVKAFGSKVKGTKEYKKIYEEFMEHGGAMDYLSTDGLKAIGGRSKAKSAAGKAFQSYGNFMSYLGETSEVSFRIAVYSKVKNNLLKDFKKENGREPSKEEMEDIMYESVREARETIDFSQGGSIVKSADKILPYLNAGTQGLRKGIDYAAKNPKGFASSMLQAMIMAGGASAASIFMLLRMFDDDEDPKKVLDVLNSIGDYEKSNYHILFTGQKDENGEYRYLRIKKLPTIGIVSTIAEQLTIKAILKSRGIDYDVNDKALKKSASGISPIDVTQGLPGLINRNPLAAAVLTYSYNYDHFYGQDVFKGPRNKKILPSAEGLLDDRVDQVYKDLGQAFGFSPKRSKAAVEKIITSETTNPSIGLVYSFYDTMRGVVGETPTNNEIESVVSKMVKNAEKKLVRSTNKKLLSYKEQDDVKEMETKMETGIYLKEQQAYNDIRKRYENNDPFTSEEFKQYILDNFPKIDAKKYAKKYVAYIKNMNGDKSILDIVFEDTPEVQAYRIYKKFGDSFDEDEKKEIAKVFKAARRKFSKKALYIYNQKYRKK